MSTHCFEARNKCQFVKNSLPLLFLLLAACGTPPTGSLPQRPNMDSLLNRQIELLLHHKALLIKSARLNGTASNTTYRPDSVQWQKEMDVFRSLSLLNKPAFLRGYHETVGKDEHSNLVRRRLTAVEPLSLPQLSFYYLPPQTELKKIEATYREKNSLYVTERDLYLQFENWREQPLLKSYRIRGFQKMISSDTVEFEIEGRIDFD